MSRGDLAVSAADRAATAAKHSLAGALLPLSALALAMMLAFTMLSSFGPLQESAKTEMALSDYALSLITGGSSALALTLFSIPIGIFVDRGNRVRLLIGLVVLFTIGTFGTAFANTVPLLFLARMITAVGATGSLTAALSLCADLCAPAARGRAMLLINVGKMLGIALGFSLAGALFGIFSRGGGPAIIDSLPPWRSAHLVLAGLGAVLIPPLLLLREPERRELVAGNRAPFRVVASELWARRRFLLPLFLGQVAVVMADNAAFIWAAPVLSRSFGLQPDQFAGWMGGLIFVTGLAGAVIGGVAADWGQKSGRHGGLLIGAAIAAALGIPAALFPVSPSVPVFAAALGALALFGSVTGVITSVALTVFIPNELRGLCIGAFVAVAGLIGFGIAPTLVAAISGLLGGEQHLAQGLAIVGVATSAISAIAFITAMRRAPIDSRHIPI